ncbi:cytochrome P450 [Colletotrichum cereale]|nr:cytochrome P450 [Colletotrichum cereale]
MFLWPGISKYFITVQVTGNEVATYNRLYKKYGLYVRVAPGELSTINPVAATDVYGHCNAARQIGKDFKAYYMKNQRADGTEGLITANLFVQKSGECCNAKCKVDIHMFFNFATFNFAADLVFGEGLDHLQRIEYHPFLANISRVVKFSAWRRVIWSFLQMDKIFLMLILRSMIKKQLEHTKFCDNKTTLSLMTGLAFLLLKKLTDELRANFTGLPCRTGLQGANLDGYTLPLDVVVFYAQSALYYSPIHFACPNEFIPKRWLLLPPKEFYNDCLEADYISKNLAYYEVRLLAAKFFFTYNVATYIVRLKKPLYVKLYQVNKSVEVY